MSRKSLFLILLFVASLAFFACKGPISGAFLSVNSSQCIGCSECTNVCATKAIRMVNNKAVIDPASCVECGKCLIVCPVDAIY